MTGDFRTAIAAYTGGTQPHQRTTRKTMSLRLTILNGPNLNMLGIREPHIYGTTTLETIEESCRRTAEMLGAELTLLQSNHEGELVEAVQQARNTADALIFNPAGYSFTSVALFDALKTFEGPIIELHISNIHARDELHRHSILSAAATAVICGLGPYGYVAAMLAAAQRLGAVPNSLPEPLRASL
jgi:3-dehydroquinate dehydratase-2